MKNEQKILESYIYYINVMRKACLENGVQFYITNCPDIDKVSDCLAEPTKISIKPNLN